MTRNREDYFLSMSLASCCSLKTKRHQILYLWSISLVIQHQHSKLWRPKYFFIHYDSTTEISNSKESKINNKNQCTYWKKAPIMKTIGTTCMGLLWSFLWKEKYILTGNGRFKDHICALHPWKAEGKL